MSLSVQPAANRVVWRSVVWTSGPEKDEAARYQRVSSFVGRQDVDNSLIAIGGFNIAMRRKFACRRERGGVDVPASQHCRLLKDGQVFRGQFHAENLQ